MSKLPLKSMLLKKLRALPGWNPISLIAKCIQNPWKETVESVGLETGCEGNTQSWHRVLWSEMWSSRMSPTSSILPKLSWKSLLANSALTLLRAYPPPFLQASPPPFLPSIPLDLDFTSVTEFKNSFYGFFDLTQPCVLGLSARMANLKVFQCAAATQKWLLHDIHMTIFFVSNRKQI